MTMHEPAYKKLIDDAARLVSERTGGRITFEEDILLPYFGGNIILRFALADGTVTKDELDALERLLYDTVPAGFLCDFMGSVYFRAGFRIPDFDDKLRRCLEVYRAEEITVSPFGGEVREECRDWLRGCLLPEDLEVWEIQEGDEPMILLLGDRNELLDEVEYIAMPVGFGVAERTACEGLMRAAMFAKRNGISLMRAIERITDG